ncbi:golgi membrane protein [Lasius niger]|uniref:Golgi membrane protein n=1 Tax=Lasius niger TaxID=67767 RepID=A0A0J7NAG0_LASNI|nr:golgi membrane protein [Lasius niger]
MTKTNIARRRSGHIINEKLSGDMKDRLLGAIDAVTLLIGKAEATGDPDFWRTKNSVLTGKLDAAKRQEERYKRELEEANKKIKTMEEELRKIRNKKESLESVKAIRTGNQTRIEVSSSPLTVDRPSAERSSVDVVKH